MIMELLLNASGVTIVFYFFYNLFLKKDTFFKANRIFLVSGLVLSLIFPFIVIPEYIEYIPVNITNFVFESTSINQNTEPKTDNSFNFILLYLLGVIIFTIQFIIQLFSVFAIIVKHKKERNGAYSFIKTTKKIAPFSFFNWIVYNPNQFNLNELEQIIKHEKTHAKQYHSLDVLFTQIICIILWFNPIIWLYRKSLKQNLEFLADQTTSNNFNCKKSYQYTLLKASIPNHRLISYQFYYKIR